MREQAATIGRWQALAGATVLVLGLLVWTGAEARGIPESFADLVENLTPAVVNISTTQTMRTAQREVPVPQFPPGSDRKSVV